MKFKVFRDKCVVQLENFEGALYTVEKTHAKSLKNIS